MDRNTLYPIFLKASNLKILIVGGGYVAEEKLSFLTKSSPDAQVTILAPLIREGTLKVARGNNVKIIRDVYDADRIRGFHIVIATTDQPEVNMKIYKDCRALDKLINVADNPPLCDFYMGGIVTKGHVKLAISTNGKSPTTAKRLRQFFEEVLPEDISYMVENLNQYRRRIKGGFEQKVEKMNRLTEILVQKEKI
ncbi:MAG: bifunctional precorrin-2 dehydrogenase/sirohydrochlorin ferrochelatase [Flavobacteriaceae bacterium]